MDNQRMHLIILEKTKKQFGNHNVLYSKYIPKIPASAEREYIRMVNTYMAILKDELEKELPKLKDVYKRNRDEEVKENRRSDGLTDLIFVLSQVFGTIRNHLLSQTTGYGLRRKLELLARINRKLTVKEWKRAIKATLGIDILEDYYLGSFYKKQLDEWVRDNIDLIKSIPQNTLDKMEEIIYDGFVKGKTTTRIVKEIQRTYSISRKRAELIARDQTAKLNSQIQQAQQLDAGITEYIWYSCKDERVRKRHRELDGKKFSWHDPPVVDKQTGRRCHPGQDYQCRCIARPVFDSRTLSLPVADDGKK